MKNLSTLFQKLRKYTTVFTVFIFLAFPAGTTYKLKSFEFGGGGRTSTDGTYSLEGIAGQTSGQSSGTTYKTNSGLVYVQQTNVPTMTLQNTSSWYDQLNFIVGTQNNPTDVLYAIAISKDNFVTTQWIQTDDTIGSSPAYQTYTNWGGASGENVIGLISGTTYKVEATAKQGFYTASPLGPAASATTSDPSISFKIDIGGTTDPGTTSPPYTVAVGDLEAGTVVTAANRVWLSLSTNANFGGYIYIRDQNAGLKSTNINYTINSATADLTGATEGYGAQQAAVTPTGTLLTIVNPYNGAGNNVGLIATTYNNIFSSNGVPITNGRAAFMIKAKASNTTPAAIDYGDTLTLIAASTF